MMEANNAVNNKRIAKNTLILYLRMFLTVGVSLYTSRVVLANLGISDYGLYNVIGGFVSMFYMVTASLTQAISRFITFELGKNDMKKLEDTFSTSVFILFILSLVVVLLAETIGLWFVNCELNIDADRMIAANWVYQFTVLTFVLEMLSIPYSALIVSHEKMGTFAFVTIMKVILMLGVALLLSVSPLDTLIFYGILTFAVSLGVQGMYYVYCRRNFRESSVHIHFDKDLFNEMFGFAGWNFLSTVASMLSSQGVNMMLNIFFGTPVNAARGIAGQINGTAGAFSKNFTMALSPQITKSYASGDKLYSKALVCQGAKYSFLLLLMVALPVMLETDYILSLWLKEVPPYASAFVQLQLAYALVDVLVYTNLILNNATGKIKAYQLLISITQLAIIPVSYIVLKLGGNPVVTIAMTNVMYALIVIPRINLNRQFIGITFGYFFKTVIVKLLIVCFLTTTVCLLIQVRLEVSFGRLILITFVSTFCIAVLTYSIALSVSERKVIMGIVKSKMLKNRM